jgi:hypothetical protein
MQLSLTGSLLFGFSFVDFHGLLFLPAAITAFVVWGEVYFLGIRSSRQLLLFSMHYATYLVIGGLTTGQYFAADIIGEKLDLFRDSVATFPG